MAGYNVIAVHENKYKIVNSASVPSEGTINDDIFIRDDGKKARIIGVLNEGFKRSFLRDGNGNDLVYKEAESDQMLFSVLNAIERRHSYKLNEQNYIVLSDWE